MEESTAGPRKRQLATSASMEESTAGPRKRQQAASGSVQAPPHLPEEVVRNILLRLPSRSVLRSRAVCKAWRSIVSHPAFAVDHHRLQPTLPLVSSIRCSATETETTCPGSVDCCVDAFDLGAGGGSFLRPVVRFTADMAEVRCGGSSFHIHGSCDGLLLLSLEGLFYVCNPATRQWTRLPTPLRASWFAGFYRHEPTGEYPNHRALFYYILVPDARRGRGIGLPSEKKDGYKFRGQPCGPPVLVRGRLHWKPRRMEEGGYGILAFNTSTEVPTVMRPPVVREHMSLAAVGGELAMVSCGNGNNVVGTVVELWLLRDYESRICACMHRIPLPAVEVSTFAFDESWRLFFMSEEGVVVVTPEQELVHYDMNGNLLESFPCDNGRYLKIAPYTFKESLVRHAFFEKQDCNADDHEDEPQPPPFFEGQ